MLHSKISSKLKYFLVTSFLGFGGVAIMTGLGRSDAPLNPFSSTGNKATRCKIVSESAYEIMADRDCLGAFKSRVLNNVLTSITEQVATQVQVSVAERLKLSKNDEGLQEKVDYVRQSRLVSQAFVKRIIKKDCEFVVDREREAPAYKCYVKAEVCTVGDLGFFPGEAFLTSKNSDVRKTQFVEGEGFELQINLTRKGYIAAVLVDLSTDSVFLVYPCYMKDDNFQKREAIYLEAGKHRLFSSKRDCKFRFPKGSAGFYQMVVFWAPNPFSLVQVFPQSYETTYLPKTHYEQLQQWFIKNADAMSMSFPIELDFEVIPESN